MATIAYLPSWVTNMMQDNTLTSVLKQPLAPRLIWRNGVPRESWQARVGTTVTETRTGVLDPVVQESTPRTDPAPQDVRIEQWTITCANLQGSTEIDIRQNFHTAWPETQRNLQQLAAQAGLSVGRRFRNYIFSRYMGGHTWLSAAILATETSIPVASIAGFTHAFDANGLLGPVSGSNPLTCYLGTTGETVYVIAATPTLASKPNGAGTLTLAAPGAAAGHAQYARMLSGIRPQVLRVGGYATTRGLTSSNLLTLQTLRSAVARLRRMNVPTFPDGSYRVHLSSESERQLGEDQDYKDQHQGVPDSQRVTGFELARVSGMTFVSNEEMPHANSVHSSEDFPGAITAAQQGAVAVGRVLMHGPDLVREKYVPEEQFEAVPGAQGFGEKMMIGPWRVRGNYVDADVEGIRVYFRAPQDAKGERTLVTWSWTGSPVVETDYYALGNDRSGYKRAVIVEHADLQGE